MVELQNEFTVAREPIVPDESEVQFPVNHELSEIFERDQFDGGGLAKVSFIIFLFVCENFILIMYLNLFYIFIYFTHIVRLRISLM